MRVNLNCPYAEKDQVKALGARWDSEQRIWYVMDPKDLSLFRKWLPILDRTSKDMMPKKKDHHRPASTGQYVPLCDCKVLPWEDCEHSDELAQKTMKEMLDLPF